MKSCKRTLTAAAAGIMLICAMAAGTALGAGSEKAAPADTSAPAAEAASTASSDTKADDAKAADSKDAAAKDADEKDAKEGLTIADLTSPETPAWVTDELKDCVVCHTRIDETLESKDCLYGKHTIVSCFACHSDAEKLADRHDGADQKKGEKLKRLKKTSVSPDVCVVCHDTEGLAKATKDLTVLTDSEGTCVNPHDLPVNESHESVVCISCHKFHETDSDAQKQAKATCEGCHHAGVYACGTCHE